MAATTIQISTDMRDRLKALGAKGDTYNDLLGRLLTSREYIDFMREHYHLLDEESEWTALEDLP